MRDDFLDDDVEMDGPSLNIHGDTSESSEDEEEIKPKKKAAAKPKAVPKKSPVKPKAKAAPKKKTDDADTPAKPKFDFAAAAARRAAGPANPGSKEIPQGAPDCLAGLTLVFTGELSSLARQEAVDLAKRYGATVTGAPSGKTSYVVIGENAGQAKIKVIKAKNIAMIDEDQFLDLIATRPGGILDDKQLAKIEKDKKAMVEQAAEMLQREKEEESKMKRKAKVMAKEGVATKKTYAASSQLWTTKYAPTKLSEICGNKAPVERLAAWLESWPKLYKEGFKKGGKDGLGLYRAVLISGGPGIGKTTSAHLVAALKGYNPIELNASDVRSKKLIENATNIDNSSLDAWFGGKDVSTETVAGVRIGKRSCLIMDEVDGMSGGDRGGVGALNVLIKKTRIPIILVCNDSKSPKMKPLQHTTYNMTFRKPSANEIRSRIMTILFKEGMKLEKNVVDQLIESTGSDIRQILNMLSTWRLNRKDMSFDESKKLGLMSEKYSVQTPFNIIPQLIGPYSWSKTSRSTLNDKMELYFQDFSFVPLFLQENYLKNAPARVASVNDTPEAVMKRLDLFSKAADSISDGDLIDRMVHSSEQHWSLLPAHAFASTIRPASMIYGPSAEGGYNAVSFPQWLGQNSKQTKLSRQLGDIQIRMRLKVSGSRQEIRQEYMPALAYKIVLPLTKADALDALEQEIMPVMDDYYLSKEDWDAFVELGVGHMQDEKILKLIPSATKAAFTRSYNKRDHPIAFHKGDLFAGRKMAAEKGPKPDTEDVQDDDGPEAAVEETKSGDDDEDEDDNNDLSKDKLIKVGGAKGKGKGKAAAKPKPAGKTAGAKKSPS